MIVAGIANAAAKYQGRANSREFQYRVFPPAERFAIDQNPRLQQPLPRSDTAVLVVHPGFVAGEYSRLQQELAKEPAMVERIPQVMLDIADGKFGNYNTYHAGMSRLLAGLGSLSTPTIFGLEESKIYDPHPAKDVAIPPDAFILATLQASSGLAYRIHNGTDRTNWPLQQPELLMDRLQDAGVTTVHVAGEYTYRPWDEGLACAGGVARLFAQEGFAVQGIREAVFPVIPPPSGPTTFCDSEVVDQLYTNTIGLSEVLQQSPNTPVGR